MTAKEIINYMESLRNEEQRQVLMRFFKTGKGDYGEGDEFLGLKVPQTVIMKAGLRHSVPHLLRDRILLPEIPDPFQDRRVDPFFLQKIEH